ncbi:EbsA family protein [Lactovum odontotermitis]
MQSGYFIHFSTYYRTSWIWAIILLCLYNILVLETRRPHNIFLSGLLWIVVLFVLYLLWPRRFMFSGDNFFFTKIFSARLVQVDLKYVTAVRFSKFRFEFSYAGKRYRFLSAGKGLSLLKEKFKTAELKESLAANDQYTTQP